MAVWKTRFHRIEEFWHHAWRRAINSMDHDCIHFEIVEFAIAIALSPIFNKQIKLADSEYNCDKRDDKHQMPKLEFHRSISH